MRAQDRITDSHSQPFAHGNDARQVLADAEHDLQMWQPSLEPVHMASAGLGNNLMPSEEAPSGHASSVAGTTEQEIASPTSESHGHDAAEGKHLQQATHA